MSWALSEQLSEYYEQFQIFECLPSRLCIIIWQLFNTCFCRMNSAPSPQDECNYRTLVHSIPLSVLQLDNIWKGARLKT